MAERQTMIDPEHLVEKCAKKIMKSRGRYVIDEIHLSCLDKDAWIVADDNSSDLFVVLREYDYDKFPKEIESKALRREVIEEALIKMRFPDKKRKGELLNIGIIEILANIMMDEFKIALKVKTTYGVSD